MIINGSIFNYQRYRDHFSVKSAAPALWRWQNLSQILREVEQKERGALALSLGESGDDCEILPGFSMTLQVVKPGGRTRPHAHSWWHLFYMQQGTGKAFLGDQSDEATLKCGDVLLVPAWCSHCFMNEAQDEDLIMMVLGNLPQQLELSNFLAREPDDLPVNGDK